MDIPNPNDPATWYTESPGGRKVKVAAGSDTRHIATVGARVAQIRTDGHLETMPGYHVTLDDGKWATVRWDEVDWA